MTASTNSGFRLAPIGQHGSVEAFLSRWTGTLAELIAQNTAFYGKSGYLPPWIAYLAIQDGNPVGAGAFVGAPSGGTVEIAYFTLHEHEGHGLRQKLQRLLSRLPSPATEKSAFKRKPNQDPMRRRILEKLGFE